MSSWRSIEVFATFVKVIGEVELGVSDRLSDAVNRFGTFLTLREVTMEPISAGYPVLSRTEPTTTLRKASVELICPDDPREAVGNRMLWRQKQAHPVAVTTQAFSLVGDVHLDPRVSLVDHLERYPGDFVPVTNVSALWIAAPGSETISVQRPFALLNPTSVLAFSSSR